MKNYLHLITIIIIIYNLMVNDLFSQNTNEKKIPTKSDLINKWKNIFSDSIDFSNQILFDAMVYIGPQPKAKMKPFDDRIVANNVKSKSSEWFKVFFNDSLFLAIDTIRPKYFYFPENHEASFLYYDLQYKDYKLSMYESFNGILLEIKTDKIIAPEKAKLSQVELSDILMKLFKLHYASKDENIQNFSLPKNLKEGDIFMNTNKRIGTLRRWNDGCIGFIARNSICIILFKAYEERAQLGLPYDDEWLEKSLYEKDGKTLVKNQNQ